MSELDSLLEIDREFNRYAQKNNVAEAFEKFASPDAVMFRDKIGIIKGAQKIGSFLKENMNGNLEWGPDFADIAASGDMGYTYGKWVFTLSDGEKITGVYVSIWKMSADKKWQWVLDTGVIKGPVGSPEAS